MADRITKETRSYIMSKIRGSNTKPEDVRKCLFSEGSQALEMQFITQLTFPCSHTRHGLYYLRV